MRRSFRFLLSGVAANAAGESMLEVVIPLVAVVSLGATSFEVSSLMAIEQVAWLALGLIVGAVVDRYRTKRILVLGTVLRCLLYLSIPVTALVWHLTLAQLFVVALLAGVLYVFTSTSQSAIIPAVVDPPDLLSANSRLETVTTSVDLGAKSAAGALVTLLGGPVSVAIAAIGSGAASLLFSRVRAREHSAPAPENSLWKDALAGLRTTLGNPLFRTLVLSTAASNFLVAAQSSLLIYFLVRTVHIPTSLVGPLTAGSSLGGLAGAIACERLTRRWATGPVFRRALLATPVVALLIPLAADGWPVAFYVLGSLGMSATLAIVNIIAYTTRQAASPPHLIGRITASSMFITWGVIPLGLLAGGALSALAGTRWALTIIGAAFLAPLAIVMTSPLRSRHTLEKGPTQEP